MTTHKVVSEAEWIEARKAFLEKEKAFTRAKDELSRERRELPWVKVEKHYVFQGPNGKETLADLFQGRSQLLVQHFMFGPGWEEGCDGCSFQADHMDSARQHFEHHDVSFAVVSRAPYEELVPFKKRMGWTFHWVSSFGSDFNYDYYVSYTPEELAKGKIYYNYREAESSSEENPGISVFFRDEDGTIYHTYSAYDRGGEELINTYNVLDLMPKGRNENGPYFNLGDWVKHHDRYENSDQDVEFSA
jgi:predicted dithiol-disulfide oxidoreductase (DUF899 family)